MTHTSILPRRRWLIGLVVVLLVAQIVNPNRVWIASLTVVGGALGLGYVWARQMASRVTITRHQRYGWVHVGDLIEERFALRNDAFFPVLWLEIDDSSDLPGYSARSVRSADAHQTIEWRTEGFCRQRGLFTLGPWKARVSDPLGMYEVTFDHPQTRSILVYPPVVHLPPLQLPRGDATGTGALSQRSPYVTVNAGGVRAYLPGDGLGRIHWPTTARLDSLMVRLFDQEPSGDLWIVLDLDAAVQAGEGEDSTDEYGVILASSLADRMLRQNRAVGLIAYGSSNPYGSPRSRPLPTIVLPQKGQAHQWRILHALATVRSGGSWPLCSVLTEMNPNLGRGMTLAVITPSCDPAWVEGLLPPMRRGIAPTVLLLDPETFGGEGNVAAIRGALADLGVPSHTVAKGMPFEPVSEHKRIGRPEYKVLRGTGRVIVVEQ